MRNRLFLITIIVFVAIITGCGIKSQTHEIVDTTKAEEVVLKKKGGQGSVHSLIVLGEGNIDGDAEVSLILNGIPDKSEQLKGPVNFKWDRDWYSGQAEIRYKPGMVKSGNLRLEYRFFD